MGFFRSFLALALLSSCTAAPPHPDHHELEAELAVPFRAEQGAARRFALQFRFIDAPSGSDARWHLALVDADERVLRTWDGATPIVRGRGRDEVVWDGKDEGGAPVVNGVYFLRMDAQHGDDDPARQESVLVVGAAPLVQTQALGSPYTVYLGNLHSQTNHSDGGSPVDDCSGAEVPQKGLYGPTDAFEMMRTLARGDFLLASEHNHMFDGSTGTNASADPAEAKALFASGLAAAASYRAAHPEFVALYGMEWGVISNGGHLNILNPDGLATWETNASGALLGDYLTPKSDYLALYAQMRARGWVGQFDHPSASQFNALAYSSEGDEVMALCEVANSNAFSIALDESQRPGTGYEDTWKKLLEAGFHVAPSSDQDNHCANWGLSYSNRTGVLIPQGTPLSQESLLAAIRARRTFATEDKGSQILLTAGASFMGERASHAGPLTLDVSFSGARQASLVQIFEGQPGQPGSTRVLSSGTSTFVHTPSEGPHFYFAKITQDNGDRLWSAPIWIAQAPGAVRAAITAPATDVRVPTTTTVAFTGVATTTHARIVTQRWSFGDGATAEGANASHLFVNAGTSALTLVVSYTAIDEQGETAVASRTVVVLPEASPGPPTISAIADQHTPRSTPLGGVAFTVNDPAGVAEALTVVARSSDQSLLADAAITIDGQGAERTLSLSPTPDRTGSLEVIVTVSNAEGGSAQERFRLDIGDAPPSARLIISQIYEGTSNNKWLEVTNVGDANYDAAQGPLFLGTWFNPFAGGTTFAITPLSGVIAPGASALFRNGSAVLPAEVSADATVATAVINFNGDDISYLTPLDAASSEAYAARTDAIGENSAEWAASGGAGKDVSLVRAFSVRAPSASFVVSEWTRVPLAQADTAISGVSERLGEHFFNRAPTVSSLGDLTTTADVAPGPIALTLDDDQGLEGLLLSASSSEPVLLPSSAIRFSGEGAERTMSLDPIADQIGAAVITVTVSDAFGAATHVSFVLTVQAPPVRVDTAPEARSFALTLLEDTPAPITFEGSDAEGAALTYTLAQAPTHGRLEGVAPRYLYVPDADAFGDDVLLYTVSDGAKTSQVATVTITIQPVNDAPIASPMSVDARAGWPMFFALQASDIDSEALDFALTRGPSHGLLFSLARYGLYVPRFGFTGEDTLEFVATDRRLTSAPATVTFHVTK